MHPADCVSKSDDETFTGIRSFPLSFSLFFLYLSPLGNASRPKEEQPLLESDYATTCTSRRSGRTACATPQKPSRKPRRIYKVERTESGERRRWRRQRGKERGGARRGVFQPSSRMCSIITRHSSAMQASGISLSLSLFLISATHMNMETRVSGLPTRKGWRDRDEIPGMAKGD